MAQYLRYVLRNVEPIRIADDSTSQSGQTVSLRYIPGTTIRGVVINRLAGMPDFEEKKKLLFSNKVRYLNAYLMVGERELIPSPKGFYEDKLQVQGRKAIQNVVIDGEFKEGYKRAALGRFCNIERDTIYYYNVDTGSDMKIKINLHDDEKQNVFRNEYIAANHVFSGYIAVEAEELTEDIREVFTQDVIIGNARSAGLGKCQVLSCEYIDGLPYKEYLPTKEQEGACYMLLLSNTTMRSAAGELCGINLQKLQQKMGIKDLQIAYCATSTVDVKGYNRMWGVKIPSALMFEQGSVFHFTYKGALTKEKMYEICDSGIGIRANEGFGRVLFLDHYEEVKYKQQGEPERHTKFAVKEQTPEDKEVLRNVAKCYYKNRIREAMSRYVVNNPIRKGQLSSSQLGILMSFTTAYKYDPQEGFRVLDDYFKHAQEKEENNNTQKARSSVKELSQFVNRIKEQDLEVILGLEKKETIMGIQVNDLLSESEKNKLKLNLLTDMVKYNNKEDK